MQILLILILLFMYFSLPSKALVSRFVNLLMIFSVLLSLLIGIPEESFSLEGLFWFLFTGIVLVCMIWTLNLFLTEKKEIQNLNELQNFAVLVFMIIGLSCFIINVYIVISSLSELLSGNISVVEFKNEGETQLKLRTFVNPTLLTYTNIVSPIGYLALGLHFYFLCHAKNPLYAIICLLIALNIPLSGLQALSRSFTVIFLLEYFMLFLFLKEVMPVASKKKMYKLGSIGGAGIFILFVVISYNRFSGPHGYYNVPANSLITDPTLYSLVDYFTQWVRYGFLTFQEFDLSKLWMGKTFSPILDRVFSVVGSDPMSYVELRNETLHGFASKFNGIVSTLVYDLSPIGVFLFLFVNYNFVKLFSSKNKFQVKLNTVLTFPFFTCIPVMFFTNNFGVYLSIQLGFIYTVLFLLLGKIKISS